MCGIMLRARTRKGDYYRTVMQMNAHQMDMGLRVTGMPRTSDGDVEVAFVDSGVDVTFVHQNIESGTAYGY